MSISKPYTIGRYRGAFCLTFIDAGGTRRRYSLGTNDPRIAEIAAEGVYADLTRPKGDTVKAIWDAYVKDREGRAVIATMAHTWKALEKRFGHLTPRDITVAECRSHAEERRKPTEARPKGIHDGTIHTELGHLRMVLLWAEKQGLIDKAPYIERPAKPKPSEKHLTRHQARRLIDAAALPHVRTFIVLALGTGARSRAVLDLTWDRCDFARGHIDLRNPAIRTPHKGRAIVPMNNMVRDALLQARSIALTGHVVEWAGEPVGSVKKGLAAAAKRAGLPPVSAHMLRHSAAVHMAEAGISMDEIAQFLGHSNVKVTRDVYARFSPDHLKLAASVLEYGEQTASDVVLFGSMNRKP